MICDVVTDSTEFLPDLTKVTTDSANVAKLKVDLYNITNYDSITFPIPKSRVLGEKNVQIRQALDNILVECAHSNWDGYGASPIDKESYHESLRFIQYLPDSLPSPEVTVEPDGKIAFEWFNKKRRIFSVSIGRNGELTYAGLFGYNKEHGTEIFEDELPKKILECIQRVFE